MQLYEIKRLDADGKHTLLAACSYFSDSTAVRAAQRMCQAGEAFEVWRGKDCIFGRLSPRRPPPVPVRAPRKF